MKTAGINCIAGTNARVGVKRRLRGVRKEPAESVKDWVRRNQKPALLYQARTHWLAPHYLVTGPQIAGLFVGRAKPFKGPVDLYLPGVQYPSRPSVIRDVLNPANIRTALNDRELQLPDERAGQQIRVLKAMLNLIRRKPVPAETVTSLFGDK